MEYSSNHIDELIGKYLAGEATPDESAFVLQWAEESEANKQYFEHFQTIFSRAAGIREWPQFDTDTAWNKVKSNLSARKGKVVSMKPASPYTWVWKVAASILVLLVAGIFLYRTYIRPIEQASYPAFAEVKTNENAVSDTLPNGTGIFLNKKTTLTYTYDRRQRKHEVALKGEAYFNVQHEKNETFIVRVDEVFIRDIGTSFNVKAYPDGNTIEVLVEEGEVVFYTKDNPGITLREAGKGVYNKDTRSFTIDQPEPNILAYKTKFFVFSGTDLATVAQTLNHVYNKKIVVAENLKNCHLTVSFRDEEIDEIVQVIAETLGVSVMETEGGFKLEGDGCE